MINRLRRWIDRRIHAKRYTPLSVQVSEPWTLDRIESELRGGFGAYRIPPVWWGEKSFDHDAVQLAADDASPGAHLSQTLPGYDCACGGFGGPNCPEMTML